MAVSKAQQRAVNKYVKNNYDEIKLRMPKGKKEIIQAHAAQRGESVNAYINRAIDKAMTEDDWMELLQVCIDLRVTPDTLIECFCWEVIRQQSLLRIVADAIRRDAVTRSAK